MKSKDIPLNISCETENLVEYCLWKFAGFAGKKKGA